MRGGGLEGLPGVGGHQLAQLPGVAEGDGAQAMLYALRLHSRQVSIGNPSNTMHADSSRTMGATAASQACCRTQPLHANCAAQQA